MNKLLLDTNCDRARCNLRLGASQAFAWKARKRIQGLGYRGKDYLKQCFNSPNGRKIFQKLEDRTNEAYPDVMNGERKTLLCARKQLIRLRYAHEGSLVAIQDWI